METASILMKVPVELKESIRAEAKALDMTMTAYMMMLHKHSRIERGHVKIQNMISYKELAEENKVLKKFVFWVNFRKRFKMAKKFTKEKILKSYKMMTGEDIVRTFILTLGEIENYTEDDMWRYTELKAELLKRVH